MDRRIESFADAMSELARLELDFYADAEWPFHQFPFGLWFRGQFRKLPLEPRVFRHQLQPAHGSQGTWDETNVYDHLKLRVPGHEQTYHTAFDWLCLMQHYAVPTRLLDWSESILPALYFAVTDPPGVEPCDGELIALNAKRLNGLNRAGKRPTIASPDGYEVILRAEMASTRSKAKFRRKPAVTAALKQIPRDTEGGGDVCDPDCFRRPIAVFPRRLNDRMTLQSSVFTLHGGKRYVESMLPKYRKDRLPDPISLEDVDGECGRQKILRRFVIPFHQKSHIKRELFNLGVHEATLFPEVDRQAVYLEQCWWYVRN